MIPEKTYKKAPQLSLPNTNTPTTALEKSLQELNSQSKLSDASRWNEYERILNAFFAHQKKPYLTSYGSQVMTEEIEDHHVLQPLFPEADKDSIQRIITPIYHSLPKSLKEKGMRLLQFMAQTEDARNGIYQISSKGHIKVHGQVVPESNILDLVHYAIRPRRKTAPPPAGWNAFLEFLRMNNVPKELLTIHRRLIKNEGIPVVFRPSLGTSSSTQVPQKEIAATEVANTTDEEEERFQTPSPPKMKYAASWEQPAPSATGKMGKKLRSRILPPSPYPIIKKPRKQTGSGYKRKIVHRRWSVYR